MITVSATELKNNFKAYADKISHGEMVIIKRPKDEKNIIMISENEYEAMRQTILRYKKIMVETIAVEEDEQKITFYKKIKHKTLEERVAEMGIPIEDSEEYEW